MDGHFVPNITFGPMIVAAVRRITGLPIDVHLMISEPDRYIPDFARAGATFICVHAETCVHLNRTVQLIRDSGARPGVVLNPATPLDALRWVLEYLPTLRATLTRSARTQFVAARAASIVLRPASRRAAPSRSAAMLPDSARKVSALGDRAAFEVAELREAYGQVDDPTRSVPTRLVVLLENSPHDGVAAETARPAALIAPAEVPQMTGNGLRAPSGSIAAIACSTPT